MKSLNPNNCRFINITDRPKDQNSCDFLFAADNDYISVFMQYHIFAFPMGTFLWTIAHTIEKYCKAVLKNTDNIKYSDRVLSDQKKYGHDISKLWNEIKKVTIQFSYEPAYEDFIKEISAISIHTRYMDSRTFFNTGLIETFTILGCEFRYEILGREKFMESFFGLPDLFGTKAFLNGYSYNIMFKKLMHVYIEHGFSFSGAGIPDSFKNTGVNLSSATRKFCQCKMHLDIEKQCPICNKKIWQKGVREKNDYVILNKYFSPEPR